MHGAWGDSIGKHDGGLHLPHAMSSPEPNECPVHSRRKGDSIASPVRRDRGPKSRIGSREGVNSTATTPMLWGSQTGLMIQTGDEVENQRRASGCVSDLRKAVDWGVAEYSGNCTPKDASPVHLPSILTSVLKVERFESS